MSINYGFDEEQEHAIDYAIASMALRSLQLKKEIEIISRSGIPAPDLPIGLRKEELESIRRNSRVLMEMRSVTVSR